MVSLLATPIGPRGLLAQSADLLGQLVVHQLQNPVPITGYRYLKSEGMYLVTTATPDGNPTSVLVPKTREFWVAPDGSGRIRERAGSPVSLGIQHDLNLSRSTSPVAPLMNANFGPGGLSYERFNLPEDANALAANIRSQANAKSIRPISTGMFVIIRDVLREPGAPPKLRAVLYQILNNLEGIEHLGTSTDRIGRPGIAMAVTSTYSGLLKRETVIIDPTTYELLGEETTLLQRAAWIAADPPVMIGYVVFRESGTVATLP